MTGDIKRNDFKAAMTDAGVRSTEDVTVEQWLAVWTGYSHRRMDTFKSFVSGIGDLVIALRDKLRGHKATERDAKASLAELDNLRQQAIALGADDVRLQIASQRGHMESVAEWANFNARQVRKQAYQHGIDLQEGIDE